MVVISQGRIHVWSESAPAPPFWQINHANSAYFRLFLGYFRIISATQPPLPFLHILDPPLLVPTVTQSHTGLHGRPMESSTHELAKLSSLFSAFRTCLKLQNWYHNVLCCYRTLLVMFCVLKFYFVDFYGKFASSPTWRLKMHVLCKVGKILFFKTKHY